MMNTITMTDNNNECNNHDECDTLKGILNKIVMANVIISFTYHI